MKNGYIITYFEGMDWIDQDLLLSYQDAVDHVEVAMEMEECSSVTMHCIDKGDVLYTIERFRVDGKWVEFSSTPQHDFYTLATL